MEQEVSLNGGTRMHLSRVSIGYLSRGEHGVPEQGEHGVPEQG